jgi:NADPH:quinone reductase-like Zn-dependent oxidoreductase
MCLHEDEAVRAPRHLSAVESAALPVAAVTAWHMLYRLRTLGPSETLLVQGGGAISTTALQLAKAGGARAIVVLRDDRHATAINRLGADLVLSNGSRPDWPADVLSATSGLGVDVAINVAGGKTLTSTVAATKLGGIVHLTGFTAGPVAELNVFEAIRHGTTFHTATAGSRDDFEAFVQVSEQQGLRPVIATVFSLEGIREAFESLANGGHHGKIAIEIDF